MHGVQESENSDILKAHPPLTSLAANIEWLVRKLTNLEGHLGGASLLDTTRGSPNIGERDTCHQ